MCFVSCRSVVEVVSKLMNALTLCLMPENDVRKNIMFHSLQIFTPIEYLYDRLDCNT